MTVAGKKRKFDRDLFLDKIFLNPVLGYPIMFILFALNLLIKLLDTVLLNQIHFFRISNRVF